ncbi:MAG TPA: hypothetical protein VG273_09470 [Bryobacteraceae bacterium]|jgi:hypothetical protein|nr:hypothetical protein [Bryobacteraceae bacterium]
MPQHPCGFPLTEIAHGLDEEDISSEFSTLDEVRTLATTSATRKMMDKVNAELAIHTCAPPCELRHELTLKITSYARPEEIPSAPADLDQSFFGPVTVNRCQTLVQWHLSISCTPPPHRGGRLRGAPVPVPD